MTLIVAAAETGWALLMADSRIPAAGGSWNDAAFVKLIGLSDGFAAVSGFDVGYGVLSGVSFAEFPAGVCRIYREAMDRIGPVTDREYEAVMAGIPTSEDPAARGSRWFGKAVSVGFEGPVRLSTTSGAEEFGPTAVTLPPGLSDEAAARILAAAQEPDPFHGTGARTWPVVLRSMCRLAAAATRETPWTGSVVDAGFVSRSNRELRSARGDPAELAGLSDAALEERLTRDGLVRRLGKRLVARGWARVLRTNQRQLGRRRLAGEAPDRRPSDNVWRRE